ncbi:MAG: divalent cation transporter, partial [Planctomycetaceae bacterium]
MNQRLLIAVLSTISMLLAGVSILLNNSLLSVIAFGGGVLVAAVALVLVPQGLERLHGPAALA